jgi:hypothetical protein
MYALFVLPRRFGRTSPLLLLCLLLQFVFTSITMMYLQKLNANTRLIDQNNVLFTVTAPETKNPINIPKLLNNFSQYRELSQITNTRHTHKC